MVGLDPSIESWLRTAYAGGRSEVDFIALLAHFDVSDNDEELAELIELDGKLRIQLGKPVTLRRYLDDTPGLHLKPVSLDAAIDVALRSMSGSARPSPEAIRLLIEQFPGLEDAISNAAMLAEAMRSTTGLREKLGLGASRRLPAEFGPPLEHGQARYELLRLLGQGGGGEVYLAHDRKLSDGTFKAQVAIKVVPYRGQTGWTRHRLIDEATKARRVEHPHVVKILDRGTSEDGEEYIVSEYVDGPDLEEWASQRRLPLEPKTAATIVSQIARGVHAAHGAGLVHCDLKPSNVLMSQTDPKVADFGIAVLTGAHGTGRNDHGTRRVVGSLAFMSPEQYRGEDGALTIPSDIYALGGILFYLLTGTLPNGSTPEEIAKTHEATGADPAARLDPALATLDRDLAAIVRRALRRERSLRHHSAGELAEDLERWCRFEPVAWTRPSLAHSARLWVRRNPRLVRIAAVSALLLLGAGAFGALMLAMARREHAKADAATTQNEQAKEQLRGFYAQLSALKADRFSKDFLPQSMAWELMHGSLFLGQPGSRTDVWRDRVRVVEGMVRKNIDEGRGDTLETALWQMTLGYWLLSEDKPRDAVPSLASSQAVWSRALLPDDPTRRQCDLWLGAAKVLAWHSGSAAGGPPAPTPEVLEAARALVASASSTPGDERTPAFLDRARTQAADLLKKLGQ